VRRVLAITSVLGVAAALVFAAVRAGPGGAKPSSPASTATAAEDAYAALPLRFEPNLGQADQRVRFLSRGQGYTLLMTRTGAVLKLDQPTERTADPAPGAFHARPSRPATQAVVGLTFEGANPDPAVAGQGLLEGVSNYLLGDDPDGWLTGVPNYSSVAYRDLYDGVSLEYYANRGGELEFDLTLAPGADPDQIRMSYTGADSLRVDESGALVLRAGGGELRQAPPVVYQQVDGARRQVRGRYLLHGAGQVGFALAGYDTTLPLVIDPVISYSTYLGGSSDDEPIWSDIDRAGNFYVTGLTSSPDFPTTRGAFQPDFGGGDGDAFVAKLNRSGSGLVWSTYLGGDAFDVAVGLDVDRRGNVVVTGETTSTGFPTTPGAFQPAFAGGPSDAFVTKLNANGSRLVFSTFLGGQEAEGFDVGFISFFDRHGNVYVEGDTGSPDFPTTPGSFQPTFGGGPGDGFVTKLNPRGSRLVYSTFVGGSGADGAHDGELDKAGNFYVDGFTESTDFPTTPGAFQPTYGGGAIDAWAAKLNRTGTALVYSTYLGGSGEENVADLTVDRSGSAYVPGDTNSEDFPVTPRAFQQAYGGGDADGYVTKLNPAGTRAVYSTYLGGSGFDVAGSVRVDRAGVAHVPGITGSADFPVTGGAFQDGYGGGATDAFLVLLNRNGSRLRFGSYLGGSGEDGSSGAGSWLDGKGNYFIPGFTDSLDFPVTPGAFQTENAGAVDVFLVRVDLGRGHKGSGQLTAPDTAQQRGSSGLRKGLTRDRVARLR
jgi:Beta-propeller repeat